MTVTLIDVYVEQILLWKDSKYQERAISFLKRGVLTAEHAASGKAFSNAEEKLTRSLGK